MATNKRKTVRSDLQVRDTGGWLRDGGAFFRRELMGQVWEMRVAAGGLVSVAQVSLLLGVSVMTVHRWISENELDASPGMGKRRVAVLSDVRKFAVSRGYFLGVSNA